MSRRLLQLVMPVFPDKRMFRIHDSETDPDAPGGPLPPIGALVSASREQLWVGSLQEDIHVRLILEEWDGAPMIPDGWDDEGKARLYLRGMLTVSMGSAGTAVRELLLSGGVGYYEARVYARFRDVVPRLYADLIDRHGNPLSDDFQREKRKLGGIERYLVQLWRDSLAAAGRGLRRLPRSGAQALRRSGAKARVPLPGASLTCLHSRSVPRPGRTANLTVFHAKRATSPVEPWRRLSSRKRRRRPLPSSRRCRVRRRVA